MMAMNVLNALLAILLALAAFGSLNKMQLGRTLPCIGGATLLIVLGAAGQLVGRTLAPAEPVADTLLFSGVTALILATQRVPSWIGERWANPLASVIVIIGAGVLGIYLVFS